MSKSSNPKAPTTASMTKSDAARIQSVSAKSQGGGVAKGSFSSRATRAAARNSK